MLIAQFWVLSILSLCSAVDGTKVPALRAIQIDKNDFTVLITIDLEGRSDIGCGAKFIIFKRRTSVTDINGFYVKESENQCEFGTVSSRRRKLKNGESQCME